MADRTSEELVLQVSATQELLARQLNEMGRNVDTFEQAAEKRIEQLEQRFSGINLKGAIDGVKDADRAFKASFANMERDAAQLADTLARTGGLDLAPLIDQSRQKATLLQAQADATRLLQAAEESRLGSMARLTVAEQAALAAGRSLVSASREKANAAANEVARLEQLQSELGQTVVAQNRLTESNRAARAGFQQAGFQLQDFVVQVAGGTSALRAFTLQAPQLFGALQLMAGGANESKSKFAAFASFLSGPWGVAIGIAIPLIGLLAEKMLSVGDDAERSKQKVDGLRVAIANMLNQKGRYDLGEFSTAITSPIAAKSQQIRTLNAQLAQEQRKLAEAEKAMLTGAPGADVVGAAAERRIAALNSQRALAQRELNQLNADKFVLEMQRKAALKGDADGARAREEAAAARSGGAASRRAMAAATKSQNEAKREAERAAKEQAQFEKDLHDRNIAELEKYSGANDNGIGGKNDLLGKAIATDEYWRNLRETSEGLKRFEELNKEAAKQIKSSWTEASQGIISSLQAVKGSIQSGDFLDILSAALGLFTQLGGIGAFGKTIQANIRNPVAARAGGGPVNARTPYLVGERGPEIFVPAAGGRIISNSDLRGPSVGSGTLGAIASGRNQPIRVLVQANDYFDARVDSRASGVATTLAMRAAEAGSSSAVTTINRSRRNRIPSRF